MKVSSRAAFMMKGVFSYSEGLRLDDERNYRRCSYNDCFADGHCSSWIYPDCKSMERYFQIRRLHGIFQQHI